MGAIVGEKGASAVWACGESSHTGWTHEVSPCVTQAELQ